MENAPKLRSDRLNLVVATCAIAISLASFYVAYLQADAEEKQVKASTWPFLQLSSSNYDVTSEKEAISLRIENAGVGPAMMHGFSMSYKDTVSQNAYDILAACCLPEGETKRWLTASESREQAGFIVTSSTSRRIIPVQDEVTVVSFEKTEKNLNFWNRVNNERWRVKARSCYCSLLEDCYLTNFEADPLPVKQCPAVKDYWAVEIPEQ